MYQYGEDYADKDTARRVANKLLNKGATMVDIQKSGSPTAVCYLKVQIPEDELDFDPTTGTNPLNIPLEMYWIKK